jgi:hypothetical protein
VRLPTPHRYRERRFHLKRLRKFGDAEISLAGAVSDQIEPVTVIRSSPRKRTTQQIPWQRRNPGLEAARSFPLLDCLTPARGRRGGRSIPPRGREW